MIGKYALIMLLFISGAAFSQCEECNSFEEALKNPLGVKKLMINGWMHTKLDSIPEAIGLLSNVEAVYLSDHEFTTVPAVIGKLINVQEISFAGCKLKKIPEELFQLRNLREVVLLNNAFSEKYKKELKALFKERLPQVKLLI
jgi:Leucine-rich repeat (LRR) protein